MKNRSVVALSIASALAITALAPVGVGAQEDPTDTTPPKVKNRKLNNPTVTDLLDGSILRVEVRANEPCIVETQLVFKRQVLGRSTREILAKGGERVAKLALSRKGRAIVRREHPKKVTVGIRATDRAGNRAKSRAFQP